MNKDKTIASLIEFRDKLGKDKSDKAVNVVRRDIRDKIFWLQKHNSSDVINLLFLKEATQKMKALLG